jgi:hypothetical protein
MACTASLLRWRLQPRLDGLKRLRAGLGLGSLGRQTWRALALELRVYSP